MYPEDQAVKTWQKDDATFTIVQHPERGHFCGYVRYPKRFVREQGYNGFLTYVPVHGGLTYARDDKHGMVYGFDCAHCDDEHNPLCRDMGWLTAECERMDVALRTAVTFEGQYLLAATNEDKAQAIDAYHAALPEIPFILQDNFNAMIRLLGASL